MFTGLSETMGKYSDQVTMHNYEKTAIGKSIHKVSFDNLQDTVA